MQRQPSRHVRLFFEAEQRLLGLIDTYPQDDARTPEFLKACVEGGSLAGGAAIPLIPSLRKAWGKGDARKANAVTEVFTMAVASRVLVSLGSEHERRHREAVGRILAALFEDTSPDTASSFVALDAQFNREYELLQSRDAGVSQVERTVLLLRLLAACGRPLNTRLDALNLPADTLRDLVKGQGAEDLAADGGLNWTETQMIHQLLCKGWDRALTVLGAPERPLSS